MLCTWKEAGRKVQCTRCGVKRNAPVVRACQGPACIHLGSPTNENELIPCTTCQGNVRIKFPLHACAIHQLCLPTYTGTDTTTITCQLCRLRGLGFAYNDVNKGTP